MHEGVGRTIGNESARAMEGEDQTKGYGRRVEKWGERRQGRVKWDVSIMTKVRLRQGEDRL